MPYLDAQKCNKINLQTYKFLQKSPLAWYCIKCFEDIVPFGSISNKELFKTNRGSKMKFTVLTKNHTSPRQDLFDKLNKAINLHLNQIPASTMSPVSFHL